MAELRHDRARQLQEERGRLVGQLRQMGHGAGGSLDFDEGFADSGQVTAERGEVDALAGSLLETLQDIDDALVEVRRRHLRDVRVVRQADRRGPARGDARGPALHHLRVQAALTNLRLGTP